MSARDDLVRATIELVRAKGVAGTGIADIIAGSGRSRRTVYMNFPGGKEELVDAATQTAGQLIDGMIANVVNADDPPAESIARIAQWWKVVLESSNFESGCPIAAAALGRSDAPKAADSAGVAFGRWVDEVAQAVVAYDGTDPVTARHQATTAVAAIEGAVIMGLAARSTRYLEDIEVSLRALFERPA